MMSSRQVATRLARALQHHGVGGTIRLGFRQIACMWRLNPDERRARSARRRDEKAFDRKYGVDTAGKIPLSALKIDSGNERFGGRYGASHQNRFIEMLSLLPIDHRRFTFVDFGSGKGKALLMASEYPFRRIVGVEFAPELHEVAARNICRYRNANQQCRDVRSVCIDASQWPIPHDPLVCYFFDPFGPQVMGPVLANLRRSWQACPRDLFIIYHIPTLAALMEGENFLEKQSVGEYFVIYRSRDVERGRLRS